MAGDRIGRAHKKQVERGVALISVLVISIIVLLAIGGLYILLTRMFESGQTIRTYTSVKDSAKGGVEMAIIRIRSDDVSPTHCTQGFVVPFRLVQTGDQTFDTRVSVCFVGQVAGYGIAGVAYSGMGGATQSGYMYRIVSEAIGPQGSFSRVEAVYIR